MVKTDTQTVARLLREYAHRSSLRGGNPYRSKAYLKAADSVGALSQPLDRIIAAGTLTDIPGIGDAIADIITKLYQTGSHPSLEKLRKEVPEGVLELFGIPGIRSDKILKLYQELGITSVAELEAATKVAFVRRRALALRCRRRSVRIRPRLALAPEGARLRLHLQHQSRRALHQGAGPCALECRNGP